MPRASVNMHPQQECRDGPSGWTRRLGRSLAVVACVAQSACASSPDTIEARYVSPTMYQNWTCEQLVEERARLTKEVQRVSGLQRENANADVAMMTVGIIVLWPVLFGLAATKDRKDELGRLKGEYEAVDLSIKTRQCTAPAPGAPSVPSAPTPQATAPQPAVTAAGAEGLYRGRGKTDSWCQSPAISLTLRGTAFEGQLSELASGAPTSMVTGTLDNAGLASLEFKSGNSEHFSGRVDGALKANTLTLDFRSRTARACNYRFELPRAPLSASAAP